MKHLKHLGHGYIYERPSDSRKRFGHSASSTLELKLHTVSTQGPQEAPAGSSYSSWRLLGGLRRLLYNYYNQEISLSLYYSEFTASQKQKDLCPTATRAL